MKGIHEGIKLQNTVRTAWGAINKMFTTCKHWAKGKWRDTQGMKSHIGDADYQEIMWGSVSVLLFTPDIRLRLWWYDHMWTTRHTLRYAIKPCFSVSWGTSWDSISVPGSISDKQQCTYWWRKLEKNHNTIQTWTLQTIKYQDVCHTCET